MIEEICLRGGYWNAVHKFWCFIRTADYMDIETNDITIGFRIIKIK